jgi:hypothetical protein
MTGKVSDLAQNGFWFGATRLSRRQNVSGVNYERNNYDLFRSIYYNSCIEKKGLEYQVASALGKPIVLITAGFVIGRGVKIELENPNGNPVIQRIEDDLNKWLKKQQQVMFNMAKYNYRDGDAYVHMDEFGNLTELDAKGVEVILDPISGQVMGCDVKNTVVINDVAIVTGLPTGTQTTYIYVKQYRKDSTRIYRYVENQPENIEVLWEKVFTADGAQSPAEVSQYDEQGNNLGIPYGVLQERKLAVKMLHNEPEAQAVYGNSDYQNVLAIFEAYADVIKEARGSVIYNASPLPVLKGVVNKKQLEAQSNTDPATTPTSGGSSEDGSFEWGKDKILYLNGEKADAKMLQSQAIMPDVTALLNIYFYLFVQGTETPEFVFGTAVSSSKASTETQIPIFVKKIERKQEEFSTFVRDLVETYIERRLLISDPDYLPLISQEMPQISVNFPPIDDEDKTLTLAAVTFAMANKMITSETALDLILGDKVKNISEEIKRAAAEAKEAAKSAAPAQSDRLVKQLLDNATAQSAASATNPAPSATNAPSDANPAPAPATGA